jgi:hypothetical protein
MVTIFSTEGSDIELKIKNEGYIRNFDLVVAIIKRSFENIQRIYQKLVFSQLYDQDPGFARLDEIEFIQKLGDIKLLPEKNM